MALHGIILVLHGILLVLHGITCMINLLWYYTGILCFCMALYTCGVVLHG